MKIELSICVLVCLVAVLIIAEDVTASGVLSDSELAAVNGGCSIRREEVFTCMPNKPCELKSVPGATHPCARNADCTSRLRIEQIVTGCHETGTGNLCTPVRDQCGWQYSCYCDAQITRSCVSGLTATRQYYFKPK